MILSQPEIAIIQAASDSEIAAARLLFQEYADAIAVDLCFQSFNHELEHISEIYGPPGGCLLMAHRNDEWLGCIGMRRFEPGVCEMKRLYVKPCARGLHLGRRLAETLIGKARDAGYKRMVLDTLGFMKAAQSLYRSLGFHDTTGYYANPLAGVVYMELELWLQSM